MTDRCNAFRTAMKLCGGTMIVFSVWSVNAEEISDPMRMEAGEWDASIRFPAPPSGGEDKTAQGHQSNELRSGGLWMLNRFSVDATPYQGTGVWGLDRLTGRYRGIWVDNNDRQMRFDDGQWNAKTRTMVWHGSIVQADGSLLPMLMTERFDGDRRFFRSVALTRKGEVPLVEIEFRRTDAKPAHD